MCGCHADKGWFRPADFNDPSLPQLPLRKAYSKVRREVLGLTLCKTHMVVISSHLAGGENLVSPSVRLSQPWHCQHSGPDSSLLREAALCPVRSL